jgi:hypothetical protein
MLLRFYSEASCDSAADSELTCCCSSFGQIKKLASVLLNGGLVLCSMNLNNGFVLVVVIDIDVSVNCCSSG